MKMDTLKHFFTQYKKPLFIIGFSLLFFFVFTEVGFAENPSSSSTGTGNGTDLWKIVIDVINGGIKIAAALLWLLTAFVSLFLYPGWVNGTIFGLQEYLKEMWILISNVVYFVFAFILVAIAFMNIIGKGDKWELKSALPRFIVWVLIVPFSWFFVQFILSLSAILTVWVLTLPYDTFQEKDIFKNLDDKTKICTHMKVHLGSTSGNSSSSSSSSWGGNTKLWEFMECEQWSEVTIQDILSWKSSSDGKEPYQSSIFGIVSVYTYGILKIDQADTIIKWDLKTIKDIFALWLKAIFDVIFIFMYLILMAALFLALFVRGIWLWMYAMFSPAFWLLYFFEKGKDGVGSEHKFSITEFISLALVPVYVSAALSFGLVFIYIASQGIDGKATNDGVLELGWFKLTITGATGVSWEDKTEKSVLARLIIQIFGLAMLWIAVMAALKQSSVTEKITKPIADFGSSVGSLVASAPMYAPIIPAGAWGNISAKSLPTISSGIKSSLESSSVEKGQSFIKNNLPQFSNDGVELTWLSQKATEQLASFKDSPKDTAQVIRNLMSGRNSDLLAANWEFHKRLKEGAKNMWMSQDLIDKWNLNNKNGVAKAIAEFDHHLHNKHNGASIIEWLHTNPATVTWQKLDALLKKTDSSTSSVRVDSDIEEKLDASWNTTHYEVEIKGDGQTNKFTIKQDGTIGSGGTDDIVKGIKSWLSEKRVTQIFSKLNVQEQKRVLWKIQTELKDSFDINSTNNSQDIDINISPKS